MKTIKNRIWITSVLLVMIMSIIGILFAVNGYDEVFAEENTDFSFAVIRDKECSIRLRNRSLQVAIIPKTAEIDGEIYDVTAIATNGFASSSLVKVRLPETIKSIGNAAFMNCANLCR